MEIVLINTIKYSFSQQIHLRVLRKNWAKANEKN